MKYLDKFVSEYLADIIRVIRLRKICEWHVYEGGIFGILNFIMYINWLIWCNKYITDILKHVMVINHTFYLYSHTAIIDI